MLMEGAISSPAIELPVAATLSTVGTVILPKERDARFITIRRGGRSPTSTTPAAGVVGGDLRRALAPSVRVRAAL